MTNSYEPEADIISRMVEQAITPRQVSELLDELATLKEEDKFDFSNCDLVSFLRGMSSAVLSFEGEPLGDFAEITNRGKWRVFAEVINMALEME